MLYIKFQRDCGFPLSDFSRSVFHALESQKIAYFYLITQTIVSRIEHQIKIAISLDVFERK